MGSLAWLNSEVLERLLGFPYHKLADVASAPESYYREREITRGAKTRYLRIPIQPLRTIQHRLHRRVFATLKPHPAAFATKGRGVLDAVRLHAGNRWFFHADIQDFYPSVRTAFVVERLQSLGVSKEHAELLGGLVTVNDELPQGAPTSASTGEIALYPLDERLSRLVSPHKLVYTRYADDLAVSGGTHLRDRFIPKILEIIEDCGWELNGKGGLFGPKERHLLLGLVVNTRMDVPEEVYAKLRSLIGLIQEGAFVPDSRELSSVKGTIGWVKLVRAEQGLLLERELEVALRG
jgi:RNA-directed DNA polymerase